MGRSSKFSNAQTVWLTAKLPDFTSAQDRKVLDTFWKPFYCAWFKEYPLSEPDAETLARYDGDVEKATSQKLKEERTRLYNWLFNHSRGSTSGTGRKKVLNLNGKQKKKLQPFQVYSQLYYESKWKATLDAEYQVYKETEPEPGKKLKRPFQYSMDRLREIYESESQEVKDEVEQRRKKMTESLEETPKDKLLRYQRGMDVLYNTLETAAAQLEQETGCVVTIMAGGPQPRLGGKITTWIVNHGKTSTGREFDDCVEDWDDWIEPFESFLKEVFPPAVCVQRVLPSDDGEDHSTSDDQRLSTTPEADASDAANATVTIPPNDAGTNDTSTDPSATQQSTPTVTNNRVPVHGAIVEPVPSDNVGTSTAVSDIPISQSQGAGNDDDATMDSSATLDNGVSNGPALDEDFDMGSSSTPQSATTPSIPPEHASLAGSGGLASDTTMLHKGSQPGPPATLSAELRGITDKDWIPETEDYFRHVDSGHIWKDIVDWWLELERGLGYPEGQSRDNWLPNKSKLRPEQVAVWIKYGRPLSSERAVATRVQNVQSFSVSFTTWWRSLQPAWRLPADATQRLLRDETLSDDGWIDLCKGGRNGFVVIVLCLAWWAEVSDVKADSALSDMLDDVHWVLQQLVQKVQATPGQKQRARSHPTRSSKRGPSSSAAASPHKRHRSR